MFFIKEDKADLVRLVEAVEGKVENAEKISKIKEMLWEIIKNYWDFKTS